MGLNSVRGELVDYSKEKLLGFQISISNFVGKFLKTETCCWVRRQIRPWPYRSNRLRRPCTTMKSCHSAPSPNASE